MPCSNFLQEKAEAGAFGEEQAGHGGFGPVDSGYTSIGEALSAIPIQLGLLPSVKFRVVVEGRRRELRAELLDELYRIGHEAIVNAYRHSGGQNIEARVEYRNAELRICVRDNGRGINPQQFTHARNSHWGLSGMRERAERIGARLRILSRQALGTEIELCVPGWLAFDRSATTGVW